MPKTKVTSIRVDVDLWEKTKIAAIEGGITVAELVAKAIKQYLDEEKQDVKET